MSGLASGASGCIGEPISWPRLEAHAAGWKVDAAIGEHLARCAACARCLGEIRGDLVALPPLPASAARPARARVRWWAPAMALAAAAAVALVVWRSGAGPGEGGVGSASSGGEREDVARVKGVGEVVLGVVRDRAGAIRTDARTYAPGDRWKVVVTCPPAAAAWIDVAIVDADQIDHPLAPARIACGNEVAVPGAFTITGRRANRVCVRIAPAEAASASYAPDRAQPPDACVTLRPE